MTQHLSEQDIKKYVERKLGADELLIFDTHMSECDPCLTKISDRTSVRVSVAAILADDAGGRDEHLTYEQLERYVDGGVDAVDKEIADVHMRVCDTCSDQFYDLRQLRAALDIETESAGAAVTPSYYWNKLVASPFLKFAAPAFAAVILGVVIWAAWFLTRTLPNEVAEVVDPTANKTVISTNEQPGNINSAEDSSNSNSILPPALVSLTDGGTRIELDANGNLKGLNAPQFESRIKAALTTQNIEISAAARELRSKSGILMGDGQPGSPFALTTPVGKIIQSDRPQFRWRPLKDAESYVVTIYDTNFNKIVGSPTLRQSAWTSAIRLKRGVVYQWHVMAVKDGQEIKSPIRPAPEAKFKILDATAANDIATAKRQAPNSHLLLGILYANAGLINEAEREFQALLRKNPNSDVARRLLNKIKAAR